MLPWQLDHPLYAARFDLQFSDLDGLCIAFEPCNASFQVLEFISDGLLHGGYPFGDCGFGLDVDSVFYDATTVNKINQKIKTK